MAEVAECDKRSAKERPRLLRWFVVGTLLTFLATSVFKKTYTLIPSGAGLIEVPVWKYYVVELSRWVGSTGELGPTSGNLASVLIYLAQHIVASVIAGIIFLGLEWAIHKIGSRRGHA